MDKENPMHGAEQPPAAGGIAGAPPAGGWTEADVREALRWVVDPELQINIVDLGLVYGIAVGSGGVQIRMTLTSAGCPYGDELLANVHDTVRMLRGVRKVAIELVWDPPWSPLMMDEDLRAELGFAVATKGKTE